MSVSYLQIRINLCTGSQLLSSDVILYVFPSAKDDADGDEFGSGSNNYKKIVGSEDTYNNYVTRCTGEFVCCTDMRQFLILVAFFGLNLY